VSSQEIRTYHMYCKFCLYVHCTRCIRLALVHDMAESIVGDITPHDGVSDADKHQQEAVSLFSYFIEKTSIVILLY